MILVLAAVPFETQLLRSLIDNAHRLECGTAQIITGTLHGHTVSIAHSGIGLVNMAIIASRLIDRLTPDSVVLTGCGGSYPNSGLSNGDLVLAECEIYGDLGVETETDFLLLDGIGTKSPGFKVNDVHQTIPFNKEMINKAMKILPEAICGPVVSVNCCSGTPALSQKLEQRTQAICENMEGAAAAQICTEAGIPLIELRGISNPTGTRDPKLWDLKVGAETAQSGLLKLLDSYFFTN